MSEMYLIGRSHPCYQCADRTIECRLSCPKYAELERIKKEKSMNALQNRVCNEFKADSIYRNIKRNNWKG